ncbi:esterase [Bacillus kwashiorkori]|uniref:esterase n=1 Tax=Bacillus kwashiorkori TaxID=1522318 RepID=UPI000783057C|nr:esterase [Bacillus kwashiorkori]
MIVIEKKKINDIPLLEIACNDKLQTALPTVFFLHGFTSAKEHNLHYAYLLAEKGFRVILPEAMYHGERNSELSQTDLAIHFWNIVVQFIHDLETIKTNYEEKKLLISGKIGVAGTSMGGITTLGALTQFDWINAAVCLMGSPSYLEFANELIKQVQRQGISLPYTEEHLKEQVASLRKYDLTIQQEKLANRPLLFWHGKKDSVVPFHYAYDFYEQAKDNYTVQFIVDAHADHKVTREALLATVDWFQKYLK